MRVSWKSGFPMDKYAGVSKSPVLAKKNQENEEKKKPLVGGTMTEDLAI